MKKDWEILDFEDCIEKVIYTKKVQRKDFLMNGEYPIISQEQDYINGYWDIATDLFKVKKPVVIFGDHTQVLKYIDFDFILGADGVKILEPKNIIESKYLYYYLQNINIGNLGYARHYRLLKEIKVCFPKSIPEQLQIVSILDQAFAAIAKAKKNTEKNLQNAKELFESYLKGVFENRHVGWEQKNLGEITTKIGSGATPRGGNESYKQTGISLVRSMNVHDLEFRDKNLAFIDDKQAKDLNNVTLHENDVLINITGASVARCCMIPKDYLPARVNQHVSIIRTIKDIIDPLFLNLLLTSKYYKDQLLLTGEQGATRQAITKVQLENFVIHYPNLKEQQAIVTKLDALSTETKRLEAIYQQKLLNLEELKKSVLQKAFSGQLSESGFSGLNDKQD